MTTFKQRLIARRGNCDFGTVMELPTVGPQPVPLGPLLGVSVCRLYGDFRNGNGSLPFGRNPYGEQVFSIRPDGTGLRQLTNFRGRELLPDGGVHVELEGPTVQAVRY